MLQLRKIGRAACGAVLALGTVAILSSASPASASPAHHGAKRHHHSHIHSGHHGRRHAVRPSRHYHRHRIRAAWRGWADRASAFDRGAAQLRANGFGNAQASLQPTMPMGAASGGGSQLVSEARRYIGGNPTGRSRLWCARFMNMVLQRVGLRGTGSDLARSFASYGHRVSGPQVGAIAVIGRRGGSHVGVVSGVDAKGNPIVVSGNHSRRVAEAVYPRSRVTAYVMPPG